MRSVEALLEKGLCELGFENPPIAPFMSLIAHLKKWNKFINLSAIERDQDVVVKHILDSLSVHTYLKGAQRILDVGTGGGFPGLPLAMIYPEKSYTLIDASAKKIDFVRHACMALNARSVQVFHTRVQDFLVKAPFDVIISRAMTSVEQLVAMTQHLCAPNGRIMAMKGGFPTQELESIPLSYEVHPLHVPFLEGSRHIVIVKGVGLWPK